MSNENEKPAAPGTTKNEPQQTPQQNQGANKAGNDKPGNQQK
jgi:hypothetical protein